MAPRGTTLRNVRMDDDLWSRLGERADEESRDRSAIIRELVEGYLSDITPPPAH